jgi:hypothetical protein
VHPSASLLGGRGGKRRRRRAGVLFCGVCFHAGLLSILPARRRGVCREGSCPGSSGRKRPLRGLRGIQGISESSLETLLVRLSVIPCIPRTPPSPSDPERQTQTGPVVGG